VAPTSGEFWGRSESGAALAGTRATPILSLPPAAAALNSIHAQRRSSLQRSGNSSPSRTVPHQGVRRFVVFPFTSPGSHMETLPGGGPHFLDRMK